MEGTRELVWKLHADGLQPREIAARLGVSDNTCATTSRLAGSPRERVERVGMSATVDARLAHARTRDRVGALLAAGLTRAEIARELGVSKATVRQTGNFSGRNGHRKGVVAD